MSSAPAWIDDDDQSGVIDIEHGIRPQHDIKISANTTNVREEESVDKYIVRLNKRFEKVAGSNPSWASSTHYKSRKRSADDSSDEEAEDAVAQVIQSVGRYTAESRNLPRNSLAFKRCKDPTFGHRSAKALNSVEFHRRTPVLLTGDENGTISLFKIANDHNDDAFLQRAHFDHFPISTAHFYDCESKILSGSYIQEYLYSYDMVSANVTKIPLPNGICRQKMAKFCVSNDDKFIAFYGKYGEIHILSAKSFEWITTLKMSGNVGDACFSHSDSSLLYTFGDMGQVHIFDVVEKRCIHRFADDGCVRGTKITASRDGKYIACGSNTGIVNVYETNETHQNSSPKPTKTYANLTTSVGVACFNFNSELLAIASPIKKNAIRLINVRSSNVFDNYPDRLLNVRMPRVVDFSPNGAFMTVGNERGQAMLFRILHYPDY